MRKTKICCIGAGYVGGPTMAVVADKCPNLEITIVDLDKEKIAKWNGDLDQLPIFEPGLKEIVDRNRNKNLFYSTDIDTAILESEIIFTITPSPVSFRKRTLSPTDKSIFALFFSKGSFGVNK